jgi:hypothetical protein
MLFSFSGLNAWSQTTTCDTWLYVHSDATGVEANGPDITGDQLTVEALFNRTQPFEPMGQGGDLVSKHSTPSDVNYLLRPYAAHITTDQGFFSAVDPNGVNSISLNVTYHVAMVYDGSTLSLYRDGNLIQQVPASGNLVTNSLPVHIGTTAYLPTMWAVHFHGYINEVRIWNTARSQTDIQTYMQTSLPSPTTQSSLLSYYIFNETINRANNSIYNGSVIGSASLHQANPNAVNQICTTEVIPPDPVVPCNTYLFLNNNKSGVSIGDVDISGNQMTIEAVFNITQPYDPAYRGGDLVSKHCDPTDVNYLLRPNQVAINTTNGYYTITAPCNAQINTTYHVALVYTGEELRFFRNNELLGVIPASGNLINNNMSTLIGTTACLQSPWPSDFKGYINEVRIWNVVRQQPYLAAYYNTVLPNPTTTPGLQAYYSFNSLQNKQGNSSWNGSLLGTAAMNQTNPVCANGKLLCNPPRRDVSTKETVLEQPLLTSDLQLYPNPAKGTVKLEYNSACNNTITIKVIDVTGKTSMMLNRSVITGKNTITANMGQLTNGIYFVQFMNGTSVQTKKLIIKK